MASNKIDPVTAVQDSIDSLALSLFEALRGVRDAVAPESLSAATPVQHKEETEPITSENARGELKQILAEGTEIPHEYLNRAFDMLEPDYHAFVLSHLSGSEYSKELVERFREIEAAKVATAAAAPLPAKEEDIGAATEESTPIKYQPPATEPDIGFVGYKFRKLFDAGWFDGKVIEIRPLAQGGKDRRVVYTDGDMEDLSVDDLRDLAKLDPKHNIKKPRLSIKLKKSNSTSGETKAEQPTATSSTAFIPKIPRTEGEYIKLLHQYELEQDTLTTQQLAQNVLEKSANVNNLVANLPGMERTRQMQMDRINELIEKNQTAAKQLEQAYELATQKREDVRTALDEHTSAALGLS
ncbi:hypothetical protein ACHAWO_005947 [Cyclotella atomus]|uniref:Mediator of RNA polymerase II transcription subunit 21 n=1 Tax=Cyclotella atomus TaxID=382360 RepID=A0ABD3N5A6_9STRA